MPSPASRLAPSLLGDLKIAARGFCMGAADIVPGVSGGTVALILGIYARLVTAVSRVDRTLLGLLAKRQWSAAADHLDLRFLIALACGIGAGAVGLAGVMHTLLEEHTELTYAAFFGLILASGLLVGRMCRPAGSQQAALCVGLGVAGAAFAFFLVSLAAVTGPPGLGYTFLSGVIGICAMILPGISGSYLLLLLGKYHEITGIIKNLAHLEVSGADVATLATFAVGCLIGLLMFSKLLKWLLVRYYSPTMAVLCGFMIGSLYKVWPFQRGDAPPEASFKERALTMEPIWPQEFGGHEQACVAIAVACLAGVLVVDALARRFEPQHTPSADAAAVR
ncbi:hypothetical protein KOR34_22780 [Posidoniimonas corsicana]|uniref:DUF368 domain-containing protein n=1 Tax=Posidoniimonas corsicana TaxID=1938618 RepID=A0A5C5VHA3_9BACT|nr:DUF368 domain-containing protein [Posidoniimonas corsicana]TWT37330.1 hypothetical protein KOR34_22780 [Posidoniimonas corsicana]